MSLSAEATDARVITDVGRFLVAGAFKRAFVAWRLRSSPLPYAPCPSLYLRMDCRHRVHRCRSIQIRSSQVGRQGAKDRLHLALSYICVFLVGAFSLQMLVSLFGGASTRHPRHPGYDDPSQFFFGSVNLATTFTSAWPDPRFDLIRSKVSSPYIKAAISELDIRGLITGHIKCPDGSINPFDRPAWLYFFEFRQF